MSFLISCVKNILQGTARPETGRALTSKEGKVHELAGHIGQNPQLHYQLVQRQGELQEAKDELEVVQKELAGCYDKRLQKNEELAALCQKREELLRNLDDFPAYVSVLVQEQRLQGEVAKLDSLIAIITRRKTLAIERLRDTA